MEPTYHQLSVGLIIAEKAKYLSLYAYEPDIMQMLLEILQASLPEGETARRMEGVWENTVIGDLASMGAAFQAMEEAAAKGDWIIDEHDGPNWIEVHFGSPEKGKAVFDQIIKTLSEAGWSHRNESKSAEILMKFFVKSK